MKVSEKGELLYKNVEIVTVLPNGKRVRKLFKAPPGKGLTDIAREEVLINWAKHLETNMPGVDFSLVPIAGGRQFNFVSRPTA